MFKNNFALKKFLEENFVGKDSVSGAKTVKVRRGYFYKMGDSAEAFAERVVRALPEDHNVEVVATNDRWHEWPKTSYFEVVLNVKAA